ncbi:hypothetical protein ACIO6U_04955 [Streptomyces sp. NPDC087422]|uniref:hypothetical protein n=1 Tax=Streptomyces sp. NPDC087422 TaxID=3365786 RepID=UPI00381CB208
MTQTPTMGGGSNGLNRAGVPAQRRRAWVERTDQLKAAATTEPGRLRIIGAVLALLVVAFGAVTAWQVSDRTTAAGSVLHHSGPLSADAAEIYRSLADADATVAGGFLVGGQEPRSVTDRYDKDIDTAAELITHAAANTQGSAEASAQISSLNQQLPRYTKLVATAQANNRQGLPLGGAYLRFANEQMRKPGGLLDASKKLYEAESARLDDDYSGAKALPYASWALGIVALGGLVWAQRRHYRRTNRVFNHGMLAASAACAVVLLWLVVGHTVARTQLDNSDAHGAESMKVLNSARIAVLQARGDENLTLVARGSGSAYDATFQSGMETLAGKDPKGVGGELAKALKLADNTAGRTPVDSAIKGVRAWRGRHDVARASDNNGDYATAVAEVIGGKDSRGKTVTETTGQCFDVVDASLEKAVAQEQHEFQQAARNGHGALSLLPYGAAVLAVLAAAGAVFGIGRRLSEYR